MIFRGAPLRPLRPLRPLSILANASKEYILEQVSLKANQIVRSYGYTTSKEYILKQVFLKEGFFSFLYIFRTFEAYKCGRSQYKGATCKRLGR
jgi:hypothetical protein